MREIDLIYQTMLAELGQRVMDGSFAAEFPIEGRFVSVPVKGSEYWYFDLPASTGVKRKYAGPKADRELSARVAAFREIKNDIRARRRMVSSLVRDGGLAEPPRFAGDLIEAFANAGFFRLRGVLVGTVAFHTYSGIVGVRLPSSLMQTGDADFAQFHSISAAIDDSLPPILSVLRGVDPTFREVPHRTRSARTTQYVNGARYRVEFLTPNTGSDEHQDQPAAMPALGGAFAEPMRFLDFLIHDPVRTVLLHKSGVMVNVPAPERYAVHKLIVASRREGQDGGMLKREKDIHQASSLFEALGMTRRHSALALAYSEAWDRGQAWQQTLKQGVSLMRPDQIDRFRGVLRGGLEEIGEDVSRFVPGTER